MSVINWKQRQMSNIDDNMEQTNTETREYKGSGNFPERLHYVLEEMACDHQESIMCWDDAGTGFKVHDRKRLESDILPTWFRQTKYTSFQRQLNIYGFSRVSTGPKKGVYYHDLFVRKSPELAQQIPRKDIKKTRIHKRSKNDYQNTDMLTSENVIAYRESQALLSQHVPTELVRSYPSVSMNTMQRSMANSASLCSQGPNPMILSIPGVRSSFGSFPAPHHFIANYPQGGDSFLGQDVTRSTLHGSGSPLAKSQELINRALLLVRSNNSISR